MGGFLEWEMSVPSRIFLVFEVCFCEERIERAKISERVWEPEVVEDDKNGKGNRLANE
ncbi:hypothetical protein COLO4_38142 [Corchorus olitorius]|uniref:Uncharacterized protein n=1 Tax=Corchorus olitorius TaxID=93759 RepID=A0A1R3FX26_9ROSI|nr:hypothetical protein COLO4_38142 [Corchorus olitorius]